MTDELPAAQRQKVDPDFLANEQSYHAIRDTLLSRYRGQWVAVTEGRVIAAGQNLLDVTQAAAAAGGHPFIARVGEEDTAFRVRQQAFAYNQSYQPFALPQITATFSNHAGTHSQQYSDVIADTGADLSVLPDADCVVIDLYTSPYFTGVSRGVIGAAVTTLIYQGNAEVNGRRLPSLIQPVAGGSERILGRDVLNQHRVVFDGPAMQVLFEP